MHLVNQGVKLTEEIMVPAKRMRTVLIQHEWSTEELYT